MKSELQTLSNFQILNNYFFIPDFGLKLAYGDGIYELFKDRQKIADNNGYSYELLGWSNGATVFLKRPMLHRNLSEKDLLTIYKSYLSGPESSIVEVTLC